MGMAASQARFLGLTARKTNIEFEGQQINQQRTSLSSESANYYNRLLGMNVPTPPSNDAFSKVQYSFTIPGTAQSAIVSQITQSSNGTYSVIYTHSQEQQKLLKSSENNKYGVTSVGGKYYYNGKEITQYTGSADQAKLHGNALTDMKKATGNNAVNMYFINGGTDSNPEFIYFDKADLDTATASSKDAYGYKYGNVTSYITDSMQNVSVQRGSNNRLVSITYNGTNIAVTTNSINDGKGYEDAYNQYTYETYLYNQSISEINSTIEIIQSEDKKLELRLKQLDTEQSAISTEMEAVSSVIKKNTEDTFKTFA